MIYRPHISLQRVTLGTLCKTTWTSSFLFVFLFSVPLVFFHFALEAHHLTACKMSPIWNSSTKALTVHCQPQQIDTGLLFWANIQISRQHRAKSSLVNNYEAGKSLTVCCWLCKWTKHTKWEVVSFHSFHPTFSAALDLSARHGLVIHVLKELLKNLWKNHECARYLHQLSLFIRLECP